MSSALVESTPLFGVSANGAPMAIFTPTSTSVLPILHPGGALGGLDVVGLDG